MLREKTVMTTEQHWKNKSCPIICGVINVIVLKDTGDHAPTYNEAEKEFLVKNHFETQKDNDHKESSIL